MVPAQRLQSKTQNVITTQKKHAQKESLTANGEKAAAGTRMGGL